jgi:hypothetical protein
MKSLIRLAFLKNNALEHNFDIIILFYIYIMINYVYYYVDNIIKHSFLKFII